MALQPHSVKEYHVFLASPSDMEQERQAVRSFFEEYNRHSAAPQGIRFVVIDWENYATAGVGRPQQLVNSQTLEKYKGSLALVIGLMGQKFGSSTGTHESGTEEEFEWALNSYLQTGFPEIKWFFRKIETFTAPSTDAKAIQTALEQWEKVQNFKKRLQQGTPHYGQPQLLYREFSDLQNFKDVLRQDLSLWLADANRTW